MFNLGSLSELEIESKTGKLNKEPEQVYNFIADFNNFTQLIPPDKVKDWTANTDSCSFRIDNVGKLGIDIIEKQPKSLIKMKGNEKSSYQFSCLIELKELDANETQIKLTINASLNPMIKAFAKKPLQQFADSLIDQLGTLFK
jgi:carbon monoxide dehydrogenase subunit G